MKRVLTISLVFLILSAVSCEADCFKAELEFGLVGFSDAESDTIILRRFTKSGANSIPKDTFLLADIRFQRSQDTLRMVAFPGSAILMSEYNYEIFLPGAGKLLGITDIKEEQLSMKRNGKVGCMNRIAGYSLNGQMINNIVPFNFTYFIR